MFQSNVNITQKKQIISCCQQFQRWTNVGCDLFKFFGEAPLPSLEVRQKIGTWLHCFAKAAASKRTSKLMTSGAGKPWKSSRASQGKTARGCRQVIYWVWWSWLRFREPYRIRRRWKAHAWNRNATWWNLHTSDMSLYIWFLWLACEICYDNENEWTLLGGTLGRQLRKLPSQQKTTVKIHCKQKLKRGFTFNRTSRLV